MKIPFPLPLLAGALLLPLSAAQAEPLKVQLLSRSDETRSALAQLLTSHGVQVVDAASRAPADVVVLQSDGPEALDAGDRARLEAQAKEGRGVVVLGSGIAAGDWMKPLAGAAWSAQSRSFQSRMMLYTLTDSHPITQGASPFDLDDHTRYDLDVAPDVTVLASAFTPKVVTAKRVDPRSTAKQDRANIYDLQPQMWTWEAPDHHRAFVLLQGRAATLAHPSVRAFLLRGVAWAAKRPSADELCAPADLAALRYPQDGPRTAAETVKTFEMQPGFRASVVASEPLINKPIAMQWDGKGRLWIAETPEYPNGRRPAITETWKETGVLKPGQYDRPATDRISILSEPDASGQFTKKTLFYEGIELVTGFCLYGDGVIAVGQPDIVFIHGEGADQKVERLFTGFTPGDTHFVANHFIAAPDGWIYVDTGSGADAKSVTHPEVKAKLSSGLFRFKPDGSAIEQVSSKGGNSFGSDYTSDGELFFGQATSGNPVQHVALPEWVLAKGKVGATAGAESVIKGRKVIRPDMPDRAALMQIDVVGGYSSACASTVYEGGAWPEEWSRTVFCTEPILDIIHCEKLTPAGPTFAGRMLRDDAEWLRSRDYWFFPVDVQFGPDGAMYVLDFYCPVVAHSDSRGPQHSRSGASIRPDRDHYFGRIYRIQHEQAKRLEAPDLAAADPAGLVRAFTHPNKLIRFTAHRLLMDRKDAASAVPALQAMAEKEPSGPARILALWALQRLGKLEPQTLQLAATAEDPGVRKCALLIAEAAPSTTLDLAARLRDSDSRVRLTALRSMSAAKLTPESAAALLAVLPKLDDDWSRSAATAAASSNAGPVLEAALALKEAPGSALLDLAAPLAASLADAPDAAPLARVLVAASKASKEAAPLTRTVLEAAAAKPLPAPAGSVGLTDAIRAMLQSQDPALAAAALPFAAAWERSELKAEIARRSGELLALLADASQPDALRGAVARGLVRSRTAVPRAVAAAEELLKGSLSDGLAADVIAALVGTGDPELGKPLTALLPNLSPVGQTALFDALATRAEWANAVLDSLEAKQLQPALLGPAKLSKLRLHADPAVSKRALKLIDELGGGLNAGKNELIAKLQPVIESKAGDPVHGKAAFAASCAVCHKFNGEGAEVGPVLDGIGVHGVSELLIHILDPSRVVDNEHRTWSVALKNGAFAMGIIASENERSLTLRLPGGASQEIRTADVKSRQDTGLSLMPEGFEALGADTLRDILAYLSGGSGKFRALNLARVFTTSTDGGLYNSREAKNDTVQPAKYGVATVEGVPFALPDPTTTPTGGNVIVLKNADAQTYASSMPQRVEIPVGFAAGNLHFLGGVAGWGGGPDSHKPALKVTIEHADGRKQVEELYTGDVFLDYVSRADVPGSKRAEGVLRNRNAHVRYFSIPVGDRAPIAKVVLESYQNGVAPTTLAITADTDAPKPRPAAPR